MSSVNFDEVPWHKWMEMYPDLPVCVCGHYPGRHMADPPRRCGNFLFDEDCECCECPSYAPLTHERARSEMRDVMRMLCEEP